MMFRSSVDSYDKDRATNMYADSVRTMDTRESYEKTYNTMCNYASVEDWAALEEALTSAGKDAPPSRVSSGPQSNISKSKSHEA